MVLAAQSAVRADPPPDYLAPTLPVTLPPDTLHPGTVIPVPPPTDDCERSGYGDANSCQTIRLKDYQAFPPRIIVRTQVHLGSPTVSSNPGGSENRYHLCDPNPPPPRAPAVKGENTVNYTETESVSVSSSDATTVGGQLAFSLGAKLATKVGITLQGNASYTHTTGNSYTYQHSVQNSLKVTAPAEQCWTNYATVASIDNYAIGYVVTTKSIQVTTCHDGPGGSLGVPHVWTCGGNFNVSGVAEKTGSYMPIQSIKPCQTPPNLDDPTLQYPKSVPACTGLAPCAIPGVIPGCCWDEPCD
jgi:hypothetical protein